MVFSSLNFRVFPVKIGPSFKAKLAHVSFNKAEVPNHES